MAYGGFLMRVRVSYFALFREAAGKCEETVETHVSTAQDLYLELAKRYGFMLPMAQVKVAVNDRFETPETVLAEGNHVIFIPPIAGG